VEKITRWIRFVITSVMMRSVAENEHVVRMTLWVLVI